MILFLFAAFSQKHPASTALTKKQPFRDNPTPHPL